MWISDYITHKLAYVGRRFLLDFFFYLHFLLAQNATFKVILALKLKIIESSGLCHAKGKNLPLTPIERVMTTLNY